MSKTEILAFMQNPARVKRAAAAMVQGFVQGRRIFSGAEGLQKTASAKDNLLPQAEGMVLQDLALRAAILPA
jgi:hypothetical protein